jgi:hypothetical protein
MVVGDLLAQLLHVETNQGIDWIRHILQVAVVIGGGVAALMGRKSSARGVLDEGPHPHSGFAGLRRERVVVRAISP